MESITDFTKSNVWYSDQLNAWMFLNKPFRRKGQAEKAASREYSRRKRLGLPMQFKGRFVL